MSFETKVRGELFVTTVKGTHKLVAVTYLVANHLVEICHHVLF